MNAPGAERRLRGHFVLLRAGALRLLLPQADVGAAGHVEGAARAAARPGPLRAAVDGAVREVAALSEDMALLADCPAGRRVACVIGGHGPAWCWDDLRVLIGLDVRLHAVPGELLAASSPVRHFAVVDGQVAFVGDASVLRSLLPGEGA